MVEKVTGELHIADNVLADIAGIAALECYGIVGMAAPTPTDGIAKILPASRLRRGVIVNRTEAGVRIDLYVIIEHGTNISIVSQNLRDTVSFAIKAQTGLELEAVGVHVEGVRYRG